MWEDNFWVTSKQISYELHNYQPNNDHTDKLSQFYNASNL